MASSTLALSWTCAPTISTDLLKRISSRALAAGALRRVSPAGLTPVPCGRDPALASRSPMLESKKAPPTSGIFGPSGSRLLTPADLPSSSANKLPLPLASATLDGWDAALRARLARHGSTECILTWKTRATPQGRQLSQLAPSMRPIGGIGCGLSVLWPTALACENDQGPTARAAMIEAGSSWKGQHRGATISTMALAMWPTATTPSGGQSVPSGTSITGKRPDGSKATVTLQNVAALAMWPTATSLAHATETNNEAGNSAGLVAIREHAIAAVLWPTATSRDHKDGSYCPNVETNGLLGRQVWNATPALWSTIRASDNEKGGPNQSFGAGGTPLPTLAAQTAALGATQNGLSEPTKSSGALNPEFVSWLMGFPVEWLFAAPTNKATRRKKCTYITE